jgi:hypothetical protein
VIAIDGVKGDAAALVSRADDRSPGEVLRISVFRRELLVEVPVTLERRPEDACGSRRSSRPAMPSAPRSSAGPGRPSTGPPEDGWCAVRAEHRHPETLPGCRSTRVAFAPVTMSDLERFLAQPIGQLRERFLTRGRPVPEGLLEALEEDERRAARELARAIRARREKNRSEGQRLRNLLRFEVELWEAGHLHVAGVDEAGMAPWPAGGGGGGHPPEELQAARHRRQQDARRRDA